MGYIYQITNLINNKKYIGLTTSTIQERWKQHLQALNSGVDYAIYKAMRKYGLENFVIEELEEVPNDQLNEKEKEYIKAKDSYIKNGKGYNLTRGGEGGSTIDTELIYRLWDSGLSIKQICEQSGHNRSAVRKKLQAYQNYSLEESNKRGDAIQGENRHIPVCQFSLDGIFIKEFSSCSEAELATGISAKAIWASIKNKGTSGGYIWCYPEDKEYVKPRKGQIYKQKVEQRSKEKELIAVFESAAEASRKTGISDIQIRKVCQGKGITAGGYYWNYRKVGDA